MANRSDSDCEKSLESVRSVLGEPEALESSDLVTRIRTNLLVASSICWVMILSGVKVDPESSFLGIKLIGLDQEIIERLLLFWIGYLLIHFVWTSIDQFSHWVLRLTGTRVAFQTATRLVGSHGDYPDDPKQSTLYNWWLEKSKKLKSSEELFREVRRVEERIDGIINSSGTPDDVFGKELSREVANLSRSVGEFKDDLRFARETYESPRIEESLKRFDRFFKYALSSKNIRWILLEFLFPVIYSSIALFFIM